MLTFLFNKNKNYFFLVFTKSQLSTFSAAQNLFAKADGVAVAGLLAQINAIGTLVNGDDFTYTRTTFTAPTEDITSFIGSLNGFLQGNLQLVQGMKMIKSMNVNTVINQQNNPFCNLLTCNFFSVEQQY